MKINKSSWHYRWYKFSYERLPFNERIPSETSLCQYVRRACIVAPVMATLTSALFLVGMLAIVTFGPIVALILLLSGSYPTRTVFKECVFEGRYAPFRAFGKLWYPLQLLTPVALYITSVVASAAPTPFAAVIAWFIGSVASVSLFMIAHTSVQQHELLRPTSERPTQDEPGLLSAYIKARKEKFCPTITFD